jgi:hypothetical protein
MTDNDNETVTDVLVRKIADGSANMDVAKHIAERTGDPRLLEAFRKAGYRVSRVPDRQLTPSEAERERDFGAVAREIGNRRANEPLGLRGASFATRYVMRLLSKAASGDITATEEFAELTDGPAEWRIEEEE